MKNMLENTFLFVEFFKAFSFNSKYLITGFIRLESVHIVFSFFVSSFLGLVPY